MSAETRGSLAVRLCNWVGEVVLSVPTLRRLSDAGFELQLFGKSWARPLLESTGWPVHARPSSLGAAVGTLRTLRATLDSRAPPMLLMTRSFSSALEARLAGLEPCGYAYDGRSLLLSQAYPLPRFEHVSHAYWHLASRFLGSDAPYPRQVELGSTPAQRASALSLTQSHGLVPGAFAVLCPFSGPDDRAHRKVWPGFAALAAEFTKRGIAVAVCPGPGEEAAASTVLPQAIRLNGIDLGVYGALLRLAMVVVANDTGPGHLAAAVGARLVAVYGPRSGPPWAPLGRNVILLYDNGVWPTVEEVAAAALGSPAAGHAPALTG